MDSENSFLQLSKNIDELILYKKRATAFHLLWLIAIRAKRTLNHPDKYLELGEAYIGDWITYCTSERCYRSDKKFLEKHHIATFKTTNKGTIARIIQTSPININEEKVTHGLTYKRLPIDVQESTNNKEKNEKNDNKHTDSSKLLIESLEKIQSFLGSKYTYKNGRHYYSKDGYLEEIYSPIKFAEFLTNSEPQSKLNPIIEDPQFKQLCALRSANDDMAIRRKMILEPILDKRFPRDRYENQWKEADEALRGMRI